MCGFVIKILKYEKRRKKKQRERKRATLATEKYKTLKLPFLSLIGWL